MEKYYRVSDVNEILNKLAKEPAYYHEGEDFYNGVCAVEGELMCLEPVQLRLYKLFPWANYMLHAHCYVDTTCIPDSMMLSTNTPVPCGALEEVAEIYNIIPRTINDLDGTVQLFNKNAPRLLAINLKGHGCILIAKDVEIFKELQKHKDNCFVQRPIPEVV